MSERTVIEEKFYKLTDQYLVEVWKLLEVCGDEKDYISLINASFANRNILNILIKCANMECASKFGESDEV